MSQLDFKDGYMNPGLAKHKQTEYSNEIKSLVGDLYETGNSTEFSEKLSFLASKIGTDEGVLAGLKDYELSRDYDKYVMDPTKKNLYYGFTDNNKVTGNFIENDWKNNPPTRENVAGYFGQIYPGENLYKDYKESMGDLNSGSFEEFVGVSESGHYVYKTTKGPSELPQDIRDAREAGKTPAQAVAARVREENLDLYMELANDYDRGGSDSAINFQARGIDRETFIGEAILENLNKLEHYTYDLNNPPANGPHSGDDDITTTALGTSPLATVLTQGLLSEEFAQAGLNRDKLHNIIGIGDNKDAVGYAEIMMDPNSDKAKSVAYAMATINHFHEAPSDRPGIFTNGNELKASNDIALAEILKTSGFETEFAQEIAASGGNSAEYFHKIQNTQNLFGKFSAKNMWENREDIIAAYDGYSKDKSLGKLLTNGIGYFTKEELEGYLTRLDLDKGEKTVTSYSPIGFGGGDVKVMTFPGNKAKSEYRAAGNWITRPNGDKINWRSSEQKNAPFVNREGILGHIKNNSPIAFYEMARVDAMNRASLYHTDVLITPGQMGQQEIYPDALTSMAKQWSFNSSNMATSLVGHWTLQKFDEAEEGGHTGWNKTGGESSRLGRIDGEQVIHSPYKEIKWTEEGATKFLNAFNKFGAGADDADSFVFNGVLMPNGQTSEVGLVISKIAKDSGTSETYILTPENTDDVDGNFLFQQIATSQVKLAGKSYLPQVMSGPAYLNQHGIQLKEKIEKHVDLHEIKAEYTWSDTKNALSGTKFFNPSPKIAESEVDNPYYDGNTSVVADIQQGQEVYRLRKKDGTGDVTWEDYLGGFGKPNTLSDTYLGVSDHKDFLISVFMNKDYLNQRSRDGKKITSESIQDLLVGTTNGQYVMNDLQGIVDKLGVDWDVLLKVPITFVDSTEAFYHFSGQSSRSGPDSHGNIRSGYSVK